MGQNGFLNGPWIPAGQLQVILRGCSRALQDALGNILMAYYAILTMCMDASKDDGCLRESFFPIQTIRNVLDLCAHAVQSAAWWPENLAWRPRSRQEQPIEGFFGQLKQRCHGNPTMKDCLYSQCMVHMDHLKKVEIFDGLRHLKPYPTISGEEMAAIASEALDNACLFNAWISVNKTQEEVRSSLRKWWSEKGESLLRSRYSAATGSLEPQVDMDGDAFFEDDQLEHVEFEEGEIEATRDWQDRRASNMPHIPAYIPG